MQASGGLKAGHVPGREAGAKHDFDPQTSRQHLFVPQHPASPLHESTAGLGHDVNARSAGLGLGHVPALTTGFAGSEQIFLQPDWQHFCAPVQPLSSSQSFTIGVAHLYIKRGFLGGQSPGFGTTGG